MVLTSKRIDSVTFAIESDRMTLSVLTFEDGVWVDLMGNEFPSVESAQLDMLMTMMR